MQVRIRKLINSIKKPKFDLTAHLLPAALLSFAIEALGLRAAAGIGRDYFSPIAFLSGAVLFTLLFYLLGSGAWREDFDKDNSKHTKAFALAALLCVFISLSPISAAESVEYPKNQAELEGAGPYVEQFDAFRKGQLELDLPVSPELAGMDNPYDTKERARLRVDYFWDRAYYDGNYYSYFGIAPIICVYYPYYALTGQLPNNVSVCMILAVFAAITLSLAFREFLIYFGARPRLPLALLALISLAFGCGIYAAQSYADVYHYPVLSAMGFNFGVFFCVLRARRTKSDIKASVLLALASLSFVLSVMSRPTAALACAAVAPALFVRIFGQDSPGTLGKKLAMLSPAALIAVVGAAVVMSMNYLRFGSVLDFGANYQLTVSDVSKNTIELRLLPAALRHYILQAPEKIASFPYIKPSYLTLEYGRYVYVERIIGLLYFPSCIGLLLFPVLSREKKGSFERYTSFACGILIILFVIFIDFCRAGVNMRYLYDILPLALLLGTTLLLRFAAPVKSRAGSLLRQTFAALCFCATMLTALSIIIANSGNNLFI